MSKLDEYRGAKARLHELVHDGRGWMSIRFERAVPNAVSARVWVEFKPGEPLFDGAIELLARNVERLREAAEAEAREMLAEGR